ncbi:MAG: serine/threonine protein kinase [Deltaproteobacteria bacterium]|nr:serine/threonine protein kinase [Deltaproteobacteria bacterium]
MTDDHKKAVPPAIPELSDGGHDETGPGVAVSPGRYLQMADGEREPSGPGGTDSQTVDRIGPYRLIECLGSGGMAVIYKSVQDTLDRTVALKVLRPAVAGEEQFARRFQIEAKTLGELQQENVVQIYDHRVDLGLQYMVMEYIDGLDLFAIMDQCAPMPAEVVAVIALHVARALEHVHYRGIVHRDIKPANVMLSYSGVAKLMDFGIAKTEDEESLTRHGTGLGTPSYMSPEQVLGDRLDGRTDIFSLGTVMFQMLTARRPFEEDDNESVLQKIRTTRAPRVRKVRLDVPRDLDRLIGRCHQYKAQDRYWPTRELVRALERFVASRGVESENALIVRYLRDKGIISAEKAAEHLELARRSGYQATRPTVRAVKVRSVAPWLGLVAGLVLLGGGMFVGRWLAPSVRRAPAAASTNAGHAAKAVQPGGIHVIAHPWARVSVDGRQVGVTPMARAISVAPGKHKVLLSNPYCGHKERTVTVYSGRDVRVDETLTCTGGAQ